MFKRREKLEPTQRPEFEVFEQILPKLSVEQEVFVRRFDFRERELDRVKRYLRDYGYDCAASVVDRLQSENDMYMWGYLEALVSQGTLTKEEAYKLKEQISWCRFAEFPCERLVTQERKEEENDES